VCHEDGIKLVWTGLRPSLKCCPLLFHGENEMLRLLFLAALLILAPGCVTDAIKNDVHNLQNDVHRMY
jgi:hypothetical protein